MLKAATMQFAQASQHGLGIVSLPASTWTPHAMMDHVVGRVFHPSTAYGVACLTEIVIAHPRLIGLEISRGLTHLWWIARLVQVQAFPHRHHLRPLTNPEQAQLPLYPRCPLTPVILPQPQFPIQGEKASPRHNGGRRNRPALASCPPLTHRWPSHDTPGTP